MSRKRDPNKPPQDKKAPRRKPNPPPAIKLDPWRPTVYAPEFDETSYRLSLLKLTDEEQAKFFGVAVSTLTLWDKKHPSFRVSRENGREKADLDVIVSLRERAIGYKHKAEKIFMTKDGEIIRAEYIEQYPPDAKSIELWLNNRQPQRWRMKSRDEDATQHSVEIVIKGGLPE